MSRTERTSASVLDLLGKGPHPAPPSAGGSDTLKVSGFVIKKKGGRSVTRRSVAGFFTIKEERRRRQKQDDTLPLLTSSLLRREHNVKSCQRLPSIDRQTNPQEGLCATTTTPSSPHTHPTTHVEGLEINIDAAVLNGCQRWVWSCQKLCLGGLDVLVLLQHGDLKKKKYAISFCEIRNLG